MPPSTFWQVLRRRSSLDGCLNKRFLSKILGVIFLIILICIEIGPLIGPSVFAQNRWESFSALSRSISGWGKLCLVGMGNVAPAWLQLAK